MPATRGEILGWGLCVAAADARKAEGASTELSTGRMDPRVGSGRVGSGHDFAGFWRVGSGQHFGFFLVFY